MHKNHSVGGISLLLLLFFVSACAVSPTQNQTSWLIQNARIIDGTGKPGLVGSVRIRGAIIMDVGQLIPERGEKIVNASGYVLAPGFIDTHSHADDGLDTRPLATPVTSQGISTVVFGQDGESHYPIKDFLRSGTSNRRRLILLPTPDITPYDTESWGRFSQARYTGRDLADAGHAAKRFAKWCVGAGTGLEYDPGIFSSTDEVVSLASIAAQYGGRYASHIRSEDRHFESAINEALSIGQRAKFRFIFRILSWR